ncbi:trehalose-6-phosphate hydrolase [Capronia coronata CBS 617.96]|uniref:Trehalose-6-phosphate hydrolase n=1 Tax=Capronia coronata CBS 617.96 TaxID=1182541 RepID=W9YF85_9EURO|nr:trehalose-6-phosphate hydrolase [Capronia coronata CBS 617.96]EXJ87896.1 trehalose-6-phosphate hydrolase [Capronia coronata CBS 617.96]
MASTSQTQAVTARKRPLRQAWWRESSVYQIYPASFKSAKSIDDGTGHIHGDLRGVIEKLDYLETLGVDIVWLSPILQSPQVDMGYDISDYRAIYPGYGTMEDHEDLISGLHARGMKYVMDLVVNHTSDQHEWFKQSRSSKDNPYRDWYIWRPPRYDAETGERMPPNNWESNFFGPAWTFDEATGEYYLHLFASGQPDLNWDNPKVVEAVHSLMRFWLDKGVDGFRMDVINFISKEPGLPDAEVTRPGFLQDGVEHFACGPRLHEHLHGIGEILREYDAFSVGEMPGVFDTREIIKAVGQDRGELAMAFQFEIVNLDHAPGQIKWYPHKFQPKALKHIVAKWQSFMLQNGGWNAVYLENHDQGRAISRFADDSDQYRSKSAKLLAAHQALQSGTIFLYQGQELAQINVPESWGLDQYKDIEVLNHWKTVLEEFPDDLEKQAMFRRQYRLIGRDNARTPMQWTADERTFAGFLARDAPEGATPWMSIHPDFKTWNAVNQLEDPHSALHYWRRLLKLRKEFKHVFVYGDFEMLDLDHESVIAYLRVDDREEETGQKTHEPRRRPTCLVITNFSRDEIDWVVPPRAVDVLFDESESDPEPRLKKGAVLDEFRNYTAQEDGEDHVENKVFKNADGQWVLRLRPWEALVAMDGVDGVEL